MVKKPKEKESRKKSVRDLALAAGLSVFFSVFLLFAAVDDYIRLKTSSTFRQHLNVLSPYISDQDYKKLISKFASMRSKEDYDDLNKKILELAKQNSIILPENKLYPF